VSSLRGRSRKSGMWTRVRVCWHGASNDSANGSRCDTRPRRAVTGLGDAFGARQGRGVAWLRKRYRALWAIRGRWCDEGRNAVCGSDGDRGRSWACRPCITGPISLALA
jgi:hypothetical protein